MVFFACSAWAGFAQDQISSPIREMRGVWVATVANIDWPSRPGLSVEEQKNEAKQILDRVHDLNLNTVVLQVRPQADAFYDSRLEPWSYYLTGDQGKAPEPFYDPLKYWVDQAHARGLELHAWFNPFRANHPAMGNNISPLSLVNTHPAWVHHLGDSTYYWMDPAMSEVQDHVCAVILDVVKRYDIDGVQFDDYFYPYPEYNNGKDFPDGPAYGAYRAKGGKLMRDEWRRDAINRFIQRVYTSIKQEKVWVKFGVSPFGVYRPDYPPGIDVKFDQYATLYADPRLWWNSGWIDYIAPQLYWHISQVSVSYPVLLNWWRSENRMGRNLWPGLFVWQETDSTKALLENVDQIMVARGMLPDAPGTFLFSMKSVLKADSMAFKNLRNGPFNNKALIPAYTWLDSKAPQPPKITYKIEGDNLAVNWETGVQEKPAVWVVYFKSKDRWRYEIVPGSWLAYYRVLGGEVIQALAVTAVDRCGNESIKIPVAVSGSGK